MITGGEISIAAGDTDELFTALGIAPGTFQVTIRADSASDGYIAIVPNGTSTNVCAGVPYSEGQVLQFLTDKDFVYLHNTSSSTLLAYVLLTPVL